MYGIQFHFHSAHSLTSLSYQQKKFRKELQMFQSMQQELYSNNYNVKPGTVEPEETDIAMQQLGKQDSAPTNTQATTEELLGMMFSLRSMQSGHKVELVTWSSSKGTQCLGV
jgi:hypothetical protein